MLGYDVAGRIALMKRQIDEGRGDIFHRLKPLIEIRGLQQFIQQFPWYSLSGLDMSGIALQHFGHFQPMFIEL